MKTIVILGASGYVGVNLISKLVTLEYRVKILLRTKNDTICNSDIECFFGDLTNPKSLKGLFEEGCIVINLSYLWHAGETANLVVIDNILNACISAKIGRFIHCSTAAVSGRTDKNFISEKDMCKPFTEYAVTKFKVEEKIINYGSIDFDTIILRPTSVFGINGIPLKKLTNELLQGNLVKNYIKSSLFGKRSMNLVHIDNVIASFVFFIQTPMNFKNEVFIVSDDEEINNYEYIENMLIAKLKVSKYIIPRIPFPSVLLKVILFLLGRNIINPYSQFNSQKLLDLGFERSKKFEEGLSEYIDWIQKENFG